MPGETYRAKLPVGIRHLLNPPLLIFILIARNATFDVSLDMRVHTTGGMSRANRVIGRIRSDRIGKNSQKFKQDERKPLIPTYGGTRSIYNPVLKRLGAVMLQCTTPNLRPRSICELVSRRAISPHLNRVRHRTNSRGSATKHITSDFQLFD